MKKIRLPSSFTTAVFLVAVVLLAFMFLSAAIPLSETRIIAKIQSSKLEFKTAQKWSPGNIHGTRINLEDLCKSDFKGTPQSVQFYELPKNTIVKLDTTEDKASHIVLINSIFSCSNESSKPIGNLNSRLENSEFEAHEISFNRSAKLNIINENDAVFIPFNPVQISSVKFPSPQSNENLAFNESDKFLLSLSSIQRGKIIFSSFTLPSIELQQHQDLTLNIIQAGITSLKITESGIELELVADVKALTTSHAILGANKKTISLMPRYFDLLANNNIFNAIVSIILFILGIFGVRTVIVADYNRKESDSKGSIENLVESEKTIKKRRPFRLKRSKK